MTVSTIEIVDGPPPPRWRRYAVAGAKLALAGGALALCWRLAAGEASGFDVAAFWAHLGAVSPVSVALALVATALSYLAISGYDLIAFRLLGSAAASGRILRAGAAATALGQLFGFGLIVGAFARWRLLRRSGVTRTGAAAGSAIVALGFLTGLATLAAIGAMVWPEDVAALTGFSPQSARMTGGAALLSLFCMIALRRRMRVTVFGRKSSTPARVLAPQVIGAQVALAAIDVACAGFALWLLTPDEAGVALGAMMLAYIGVLALCLIANTPGGVGPLEAGLLFALPHAGAEALLAGVVAFRVVYYIAPALLAIGYLVDAETGGRLAAAATRWRRWIAAPPRLTAASPARPLPTFTRDDPRVRAALALSGRAEDELAHLGDKSFLPSARGDAFLMHRAQGRALIAIGDPVGAPTKDRAAPRMAAGGGDAAEREATALAARFIAHAARQGMTPVFYRTGPVLAEAARRRGLRVDRIGHEAVIDLAAFTIAGRDRREIRRKARKAAKAGAVITAHAPGDAPLAAYARLCAEWQAARGARETAFSMGICAPEYLNQFPIYEARVGGAPVAILSVWRSGDGREWSLDVMRHAANAPNGVMQALIVAACDGARAAGAERFNLCLAPLSGLETPESMAERAAHVVYRLAERSHSLQGLRRFKAAFRPDWRPRYVARAPGLAGLYGLWATRRLIVSGGPAGTARLSSPPATSPKADQSGRQTTGEAGPQTAGQTAGETTERTTTRPQNAAGRARRAMGS